MDLDPAVEKHVTVDAHGIRMEMLERQCPHGWSTAGHLRKGNDRDIIVSQPESGLSVTYRKYGDAPMLVAIEGIDEIDRFDQARLNFLAKAWKAAHAKALAVGWLHS